MDPAHRKARSLVAAGDYASADPWFLNALARNPGDLSLIVDFSKAVQAAAAARKRTAPQEAQRQLEWLSDFVSERVAHVDPSDLEALLSLQAKVRAVALSRSSEHAVPKPRAAEHAPLDFASFAARIEKNWPSDAGGLRAALDTVHAISDVPEDDSLVGRLAGCLAFDELLPRAEHLLTYAQALPDPTECAYLLTGVEAGLRDAYQHLPELDPARTERLRALRNTLERLSVDVAERQANRASTKAWLEWRRKHRAKLDAVQDWEAPEHGVPKGTCQKRIDSLQKLAGSLQAVLSQVHSGDAQDEATSALELVRKALEQAATAQHQQYNLYAMKSIQCAYKLGCEQLGVVRDDKEPLAKLLIAHLGNIDQRMLTSDVQRTYSEVFEYLFEKLSPPKKKSESFRDAENRLFVLHEMSKVTKRRLQDF